VQWKESKRTAKRWRPKFLHAAAGRVDEDCIACKRNISLLTKNEIKYLLAHLKCGAMQMNLGLKRLQEKEAQDIHIGPPFLGAKAKVHLHGTTL
jgi:hypothetical protein